MNTPDLDSEEILAHYKWSFLQCRVDRHRWDRQPFYSQNYPDFVPGYARRYQTCRDCSMQRWKEINVRTSEYTGRYGYVPPRGYYTPKTGLTLADFAERLYAEDYAAAVEAGRIEYAPGVVQDDDAPVTAIGKKAG